MESKGINMILETKLNGVKRALEETFSTCYLKELPRQIYYFIIQRI